MSYEVYASVGNSLPLAFGRSLTKVCPPTTFMKLGSILAWPVPELRKMSGSQMLKVWGECTPYSRNRIYVHIVILLACSSAIFNVAMRLSNSLVLDLIGLGIGLLVPPNLYFHLIFKKRRAEIRRFVEENWDELRPE